MTLEHARDSIKAAIAELRQEQTTIGAKIVGLSVALEFVEDDIDRAKRHTQRQQQQPTGNTALAMEIE